MPIEYEEFIIHRNFLIQELQTLENIRLQLEIAIEQIREKINKHCEDQWDEYLDQKFDSD